MSEQVSTAPTAFMTKPDNFTRPADTTAYASGDLVANSTTAGSVVPLKFCVDEILGQAKIRRARISKSGALLTNAQFRLHLYQSAPTPANGDNGAWSTTISGYLGSLTLAAAMGRAFTDGAADFAVPDTGTEIIFDALGAGPGLVIYGLLEARAAYTPASAEVFTVTLEMVHF